jgi:hypothetical protein
MASCAADARARGLGARLFEWTEGDARRRRRVQLALDTHSFQAPISIAGAGLAFQRVT